MSLLGLVIVDVATGDLWVMRPDGSDLRMLTDDQFEDGTPSWLPMSR